MATLVVIAQIWHKRNRVKLAQVRLDLPGQPSQGQLTLVRSPRRDGSDSDFLGNGRWPGQAATRLFLDGNRHGDKKLLKILVGNKPDRHRSAGEIA